MNPGLAFLLLSVGLSWSCWAPAILGASAAGTVGWLAPAGSLGPLVAALLLTATQAGQASRAAWTQRLRNWRGLLSAGGALSVLLPVVIALLALRSYAGSGGIVLAAVDAAEFLPLALPLLLAGVLPEELAWRGYAQPVVLRSWQPLSAALLIGLAWYAWQLPLFWIAGTYQSGVGVFTLAGGFHLVNLLAEAVILCALLQLTGSVWSAVIFRALTCIAGELWQLPVEAELHRGLWTVAAALPVLMAPGAFRMNGSPTGGLGRTDAANRRES